MDLETLILFKDLVFIAFGATLKSFWMALSKKGPAGKAQVGIWNLGLRILKSQRTGFDSENPSFF